MKNPQRVTKVKGRVRIRKRPGRGLLEVDIRQICEIPPGNVKGFRAGINAGQTTAPLRHKASPASRPTAEIESSRFCSHQVPRKCPEVAVEGLP